jgi:hypothetical protein
MKIFAVSLAAFLALAGARLPAQVPAAAAPGDQAMFVVDANAVDLAAFEKVAARAKEIGATHLVVTNDLPLAKWEFDVPGDPYPAWYVYRPGLLKIFPPKEVQPYVDSAYAEEVAKIIEDRCAVLRKYGLKAYWAANEPQVMPEAFFGAYPELRGPRVDQPNRSRAARFAPCTDRPETLRLYREAMKLLLTRCPEVEVFNFLTTDSGSGFSWAPGLYPGMNGPSDVKDRPMEDRVSEFMINLQEAGREAGHAIEVNIRQEVPRQWMEPTFANPMAIVRKLPRGLAIDNREGPDGRTFLRTVESRRGVIFYPVVGIAYPGTDWSEADAGKGGRRMLAVGDSTVQDFNFRLYQATRDSHPRNAIERLTVLRAFAVSLAGETQADNLLAAWIALNKAQDGLADVDFGPVLRMGDVLTRWVDRPMVPFPDKLTPAEKSGYRPYLFQAKGEDQADDLVDIQGMRMYEGWGAKMLFQRVVENVVPHLEEAIERVKLVAAAGDEASRPQWDLLGKRLEAAVCLVRGADNMVSYQAQLDRAKARGAKPEENPVLGTLSGWDRTDLMETARKEIDNTVRLLELVKSTPEPIFDMAPTPEEEGIMRLGPDLPAQLQRKINTMNAHWEDYRRLFTEPNP